MLRRKAIVEIKNRATPQETSEKEIWDVNRNSYQTDRHLRRDVMQYVSSEIKKLKTPKQMMDKIEELLNQCKMDECTLSEFPYGYQLADHLVASLNCLVDDGKLKSNDAERWNCLKSKYYDHIMGE